VTPASGPFIGAAVLVHGLWGNPHDWRWVKGLLEDANVQVITSDLPSHRTPTAGLVEDADEVRQAIRASDPPVAAVGWSYGCSVISLAAAGEESVSRLIYVSDIPRPAGFPGDDLGWIDADPHMIVRPDGRFVLDNDLWLKDEGETFPEEVCEHFRDHPRRQSHAWSSTAGGLGDHADNRPHRPGSSMLSEADRKWAGEHLNDVRVIDTDHFIIFRRPDLVAQLVLDALERTT
jgi:pimeloyl-ACP methyl ester carboxylesterase